MAVTISQVKPKNNRKAINPIKNVEKEQQQQQQNYKRKRYIENANEMKKTETFKCKILSRLCGQETIRILYHSHIHKGKRFNTIFLVKIYCKDKIKFIFARFQTT